MLSRWVRILFGLIIAVVCPQLASAQSFGLTVSAPATVNVSNNIPYTITVSNATGILLSTVSVSSVFPTSLHFVSASPTNRGPFTAGSGMVTFVIDQFAPNERIQFNLTLRTTQEGRVTNVVTVSGGAITPAVQSAVTTVGTAPGRSDLSVSIQRTDGNSTIFVNDWVPYTILVTRQGDAVSEVFVTNTLPRNVIVQDQDPIPVATSVGATNQTLIFGLGTLSDPSFPIHVRVQPTEATNFTISARLGSSGNADTNAANNSTSITLSATNAVFGELSATRASDQVFNPQNSYMEQLITLMNTSTNVIPTSRVILSNINYQVMNAVGTNNGNPFVVHAAALQPTQTVELLLEYFIPSRTPDEDPQLLAHSAGTIDLTPPSSGTNVAITNIMTKTSRSGVASPAERLVIEFPANPGATYQILYSSNMTFSGAIKAQPAFEAQANRVQWIDYGPPKTLSRPALNGGSSTNGSNSMRFYRAIQLP